MPDAAGAEVGLEGRQQEGVEEGVFVEDALGGEGGDGGDEGGAGGAGDAVGGAGGAGGPGGGVVRGGAEEADVDWFYVFD